jgi:hypothetical protein
MRTRPLLLAFARALFVPRSFAEDPGNLRAFPLVGGRGYTGVFVLSIVAAFLRQAKISFTMNVVFFLVAPLASWAGQPFVIKVVDESTNRGVPLVELTTVHGVANVTDNAGLVAFHEPGLMNAPVFFKVTSHGYEYPKDGLGFQGKRLMTIPGETAIIRIKRINLAERLCRLTGAGLYHHSARAGLPVPVKHPLLNAKVLGSDSVHTAIYRNKLFWLWGDTNRPRYPLGNFDVTMATSPLVRKGDPRPVAGVNYAYFTGKDGFARKMAPIAGQGPTWLEAMLTLKDKKGKERLVATYVKVRQPMKVYEAGLCEFNPEKEVFEKRFTFSKPKDRRPAGHPLRHRMDGRDWVYCGSTLPDMRFPDNYESWLDPSTYEVVKVDMNFTDPEDNEVKRHNGHVAWNPSRKRWVSIFTQSWAKPSFLGEIWYAEAPAPEGPWRKAVKIMTHDRYSFYNPMQHPYWAEENGRVIYFEGTYTVAFSGNRNPTPRYDYNQILYRLDLSDPRLRFAQMGPSL